MNVLYITHNAESTGGANVSLLCLMAEMQKRGVKVYLLMPYKSSRLTLQYRLRGIRVIACNYEWWMSKAGDIGFGERLRNFLSNYISAYKISAVIRRLNIDIIHTNSSVINIGGLLSKITGISHVWHIREFAEEHFELKHIYGYRASMRFMYKHSERIIAISGAIYDKFREQLGEKLALIYNGISKDYINIKLKSQPTTRTELLMVGAVYPAKGQLEAVLAVDHLIKWGYKDLHLTIVGSVIDAEYLGKMKEVIENNALQGNIDFIEFRQNLNELRQNADIELVCSRSEAFGRVTIEAMMSMNPVIGADSGGTKELIIDGYNGLLYKSGDYVDLADKIRIMTDDPESIKTMGVNAFGYTLENYTAEKNAEEIYKLYCEILSIKDK